MSEGFLGRRLNNPELRAALRPLRETNNSTNLRYLAIDYLTIALVVGLAVSWSLARQSWGWSWLWDIPSSLLAIVLIGGLQHRLAGLAHEASHFTLFKNRLANDLVADLFCMFPVFATIHQYRIAHLAHHQFTNDWQKDPDLTEVGRPKGVHEFPMTRGRFVYRYYVRFFLPWVLLGYMWKIAYQSVLGKGNNPYLRDPRFGKGKNFNFPGIRWASVGGVAYVIALATSMSALARTGQMSLLLATVAVAYSTAMVVMAFLPATAYFQSPVKHAYSSRVEAMLRLTWMTTLLASFPAIRMATGVNVTPYFWLFWVTPLLTSFAYFMLLRDVYQHANADRGKLTNSRVFFTDRFTWWAVFVYGQDMHIPHHLFPTIPHYNLPKAHEALKSVNDEYREYVVECHGTFRNESGLPTILDVMEQPTKEPEFGSPAVRSEMISTQEPDMRRLAS